LLIGIGAGGCGILGEKCAPQVQCEKPTFLCESWRSVGSNTNICEKGVMWREGGYRKVKASFTDVGE
jgi:hypothetical protein